MPQPATFSERAMRGAIRALGSLPEPAQRLIAGKPVIVDGQQLYTEVQMALRLLNALPGSDFSTLPLAEARAQIDAEARIFGGTHEVAQVDDLFVPTRAGRVPARRYARADFAACEGTLVYFHGGGWVVGSIESADSACRFIAEHTKLEVISVEYRLAPEHPFPAGLEDAIDAYRWARDRAASVDAGAGGNTGAVARPVIVAGDSAGGNLSASVCLATLDDEAGPPDFQLLFFPVTDLSTKHRSYELFSDGYFLTEKQMDWYRGHYLADPDDAQNPLASPILASDAELRRMPPAHVAVSGFDVLRDEGIEFANRLREAGVPVTLQVVSGHIHAFVNATGVGKLSAQAIGESVAALQLGLAAGTR